MKYATAQYTKTNQTRLSIFAERLPPSSVISFQHTSLYLTDKENNNRKNVKIKTKVL